MVEGISRKHAPVITHFCMVLDGVAKLCVRRGLARVRAQGSTEGVIGEGHGPIYLPQLLQELQLGIRGDSFEAGVQPSSSANTLTRNCSRASPAGETTWMRVLG